MAARPYVASYGFLAATAVWTLGWIAAASLAVERMKRSRDAPTFIAVAVAFTFAAVGLWVSYRVATGHHPGEPARAR